LSYKYSQIRNSLIKKGDQGQFPEVFTKDLIKITQVSAIGGLQLKKPKLEHIIYGLVIDMQIV